MGSIAVAGGIALASDASTLCVLQWMNAIRRLTCPEMNALSPATTFPSGNSIQSLPIIESNVDRVAVKEAWGRETGFMDWDGALSASADGRRWGPAYWQALHDLSCFYSPDRHTEAIDIIRLLPVVLPCRKCRIHVRQNLISLRSTIDSVRSRTDYVNLVISLHNRVSLQVVEVSDVLLHPFLQFRRGTESSVSMCLKWVGEMSRSSRGMGERKRDSCGCTQKAVSGGRVPGSK